MDQINAVVDCDVARLNVPLRTLFPRVGHNYVALFRRVPADVTHLFVRIFRENGAYYDISATEHMCNAWSVRFPASCFGSVGSYKYEVHATAADDQPCAIGEGGGSPSHLSRSQQTRTRLEQSRRSPNFRAKAADSSRSS